MKNLVEILNEDIWAILPSAFARILAAAEENTARPGEWDMEAAVTRPSRAAGAIAILPLYGILQQRPSLLAALFGATSLEVWSTLFKRLVADDSIKAIILDIDSPGGSVGGIQELADEIYQARERKPIIAVANTLAASAAYWLASSASEIVASPSAEVGSIGVFALHVELSKALEIMGIKPTLISAGKYKTEGNPYEPLTAEAEGAIQERVDDYYNTFVASVARGRGALVSEVRGGFGEGRVLGVKEAKKLGMIDRVATLAQTVQRHGGTVDGGGMMAEFISEGTGSEMLGVEGDSIKGDAPPIQAPYPSEHSCRLRDPSAFKPDSFRRTSRNHKGKSYDVISGKLKGESSMTEQAFRYDKKTWNAGEARSHCEDHKGKFEPASGGGASADTRKRRLRLAAR